VKGIPPAGVGLSDARAGLKIEDADPFGEYTLKATITDKIKEVTATLFHFSSLTRRQSRRTDRYKQRIDRGPCSSGVRPSCFALASAARSA